MDMDNVLLRAVQDGIRDGVKRHLEGDNSSLSKMIESVMVMNNDQFRALLSGALESAIGDATFRDEVSGAVRHKLAQVLIQRFGGELEKQVNALKSDPTTRARITIAIEEIVKGAA